MATVFWLMLLVPMMAEVVEAKWKISPLFHTHPPIYTPRYLATNTPPRSGDRNAYLSSRLLYV